MKKFLKAIVTGIFIGFIILVLDQSIRYFNTGSLEWNGIFWIYVMYYMLYSIPLTLVNTYYFEHLNTKVNWEKYKSYRLSIGFFGSVFITLVTIFLVRMFIKVILEGENFQTFIAGEQIEYYLVSLFITLIISLFFHAIYFYKELQKNKVKEQQVIAGTASAKFDALKNQLDPHFLFNSLNVLTSLIEENPNNAMKFTTALSKVYRYVLEQKNKDLVTVDEELDFARTYMLLLKMRFEDSVVFEIPEKSSNPESKVVPLSLQLLLENAVKHNIVTTQKPLKIRIYEIGNNLIIENNLQPKQILKKGSGVGLSNIKQRYQILSTKQVLISEQSGKFTVSLPMLTKQISVMNTSTINSGSIDDRYVRARKRVEALKEFYYNLISYVIVIPILFLIWYKFTPHVIQWFWFPMIGWGISVVFQAYTVFVDKGAFGANWEQRKIEEFMKQEQRNKYN